MAKKQQFNRFRQKKKGKNNRNRKSKDNNNNEDENDIEMVDNNNQKVIRNSRNFTAEDNNNNNADDDGNQSDGDYHEMRMKANKSNNNNNNKMKKNKKGGGFQAMGFGYSILKGVLRKGYRIPTPIQRKAIPLIMSGKDVVAMARTGSGKTAAFLLPVLDKLKSHSAITGVRALIISPTRELAIQTHKFTKELTRFTDLKSTCVLGGDSMEKQFAAIHENPDIVVATPGRLMHIVVEMNLKLSTVEYIVFDEADRLFEMGFREQLNEILSRLPEQRQTLLFSATLPQLIVDFTKAGLNDPVLVRLDTESKLSDNLKTIYLTLRKEDKTAVLLYLLKHVIKISELTVIFVETRHHIEYIKDILNSSGIECSFLYSSMDFEARKLNVQRFQTRKVHVLLVTDLAARGVDIPLLDNVINYNFPAKSKLFVHRVGRVARAGRFGTAYSLVATDEMPYVHSLNLFLNREFKLAKPESKVTDDGLLGTVPQELIDEETETLDQMHSLDSELSSMKIVCHNAYKQYLKSRPTADNESVRIVKQMAEKDIQTHPIFRSRSNNKNNNNNNESEKLRNDMLNSIRGYRPNSTIFETGKTRGSTGFEVMQQKRKLFDKLVVKKSDRNPNQLDFDQNKDKFKDNEFYVRYQSDQHFSEKGLEMDKPFNAQMASAVLDFNGDESQSMNRSNNALKWDRKKKKFLAAGNTDNSKKKKIKTESGNWISASYKSDLYKKWKQKSKTDQQISDDEGDGGVGGEEEGRDIDQEKAKRNESISKLSKKMMKDNNKQSSRRPPKRELKNREEIYKERQRLEKKKSFQKWRQSEKAKHKNNINKKS
ncbi:ATP-dependent RNA helicase DDX54-like [Oppia nitens]|uniref:ATP-dependent RNA helicase DDX54-like n=1 Tax=Oppia nitens TaxID=1686743 RepID=UPI0023DBFCF3|nr:ATP-dependent RNA helicase DDX54-like [Oppia nitens]